MAVRLNVIMVAAPPASAAAQRLAESVVGEVIGRPGIDLTLIGPLDLIRDGSTDRLTLESITSDTAVLGWQQPDSLVDSLSAVGFDGHRWPHQHDPDALPPSRISQRKIYAYDLSCFNNARIVCEALGKLLASRQVTTYSLPGQQTSKVKNVPIQASLPSADKPASTTPKERSSNAPTIDSVDRGSESESAKKGRTERDLDDLVDQLDDFDP